MGVYMRLEKAQGLEWIIMSLIFRTVGFLSEFRVIIFIVLRHIREIGITAMDNSISHAREGKEAILKPI
jgi:hypothetical protein